MMEVSRSTFKFLHASIDDEVDSEFRLLVGGKQIKYMTIDGGLFDTQTMTFGPSLIPLLPPLPSTEWNEARVSRKSPDGEVQFTSVQQRKLLGVNHVWHPLKFDYLDLELGEKLRTNVYEAAFPGSSFKVIAKFARFEWEIEQIDHETEAYQWIEGCEIGPKFLGHILEHGRVIGFLIEKIPDCRHAEADDLLKCQTILSRLHQIGIKHGDTNKHNFLVSRDRTVLVDFDCALQDTNADTLEKEMYDLEGQLNDPSGRGGETSNSASESGSS